MNVLNCREYIERFLKIRTKEGNLVSLKLNEPQQRLYSVIKKRYESGKPVRVIVLKARQMGFSTLTEAIIFWATATRENTDSMIIAHKDEATANLFRMSKLFYENLPEPIKPMLQASNAQELNFDRPARGKKNAVGLRSRIRCATAGGSGQGRSYTLRNVHMSEFAFWPGDKKETYSGIMQAVPDMPGTIVVIESTANGYDEFKALWDMAVEAQARGDEEGFIPVFFPWHEMREYQRDVPPGFEKTEEERELAKAFGLSDRQLAWRRWCIEVNCSGDVDKFRQEYPATPDEAFISTGSCVFDKPGLVLRRAAVKDAKWEYGKFEYNYDGLRISDIRWAAEKAGIIRIYRHPEPGKHYVIGADTAGTGSDYFAAHVLDNSTGEQVAVLHHRMDETLFTRQLYCLGQYYNGALLGVETNYSTYPVMELQRLEYPRQYVRQSFDSYTKKLSEAYGFVTSSRTRPMMIDNLKSIVRETPELIGDYETLGEMLTFVYNANWRPEAEQGEHDDLVMSLAIAHQIRDSWPRTAAAEALPGTAEWTADMWEDYNNASPAEQDYLIGKWGKPRRS